MADFTKDVVDQLKDQNKKLDVVVSNTAKEVESGAKASEEKKEAAAQEQKRTSLFEQMADGISQLNKSFLKIFKRIYQSRSWYYDCCDCSSYCCVSFFFQTTCCRICVS